MSSLLETALCRFQRMKMANLFICPFKHEKVSAEGYSAGDSIQRFRRRLETVKESGICWFKSNNGHHPMLDL